MLAPAPRAMKLVEIPINLYFDNAERTLSAAAGGGLWVGCAGDLHDVAERVTIVGATSQLDLQTTTRHWRKRESHVTKTARCVAREDYMIVNEYANGV